MYRTMENQKKKNHTNKHTFTHTHAKAKYIIRTTRNCEIQLAFMRVVQFKAINEIRTATYRLSSCSR